MYGTPCERLHLSLEDQPQPFGYVELPHTERQPTLAALRNLILSQLGPSVPVSFSFLLPGGGPPISRVQEHAYVATDLLPCATIRPQSGASSKPLAAKISVLFRGERFTAWTTSTYTFMQLRRDAAQFWDLPPNDVAILDADGTAYPEDATIKQIQESGLLNDDVGTELPVVFLSPKPTRFRTGGIKSPTRGMQRQSPPSVSLDSFANVRSTPSHELAAPVQQNGNSGREGETSNQHPTTATDYGYFVPLWHIFTYYAAQGNPLHPTFLDKRQWGRLMRDCRLIEGGLTLPVLQLVYTSACSTGTMSTSARSQSTKKGRMGFDKFLDALVDIAARVYPNIANPVGQDEIAKGRDAGLFGAPTRDPATAGTVRALVVLLTSHLLPLASKWPVEKWHVEGTALRTPEVRAIFGQFAHSLYEIFKFYAPPVLHSNRVDVEEGLALTTTEFQRAVQDFAMVELGLSSAQCSEVFLAAAESGGIAANTLHTTDGHAELLSLPGRDIDASRRSSSMFADTYEYRDGSYVWDSPVLYFEHFIDALGRLSIAAFLPYHYDRSGDEVEVAKPSTESAVSMVMALFQHLAKTLAKDRVLRLVAQRSNCCTNAAGMLRATAELGKTFLAIWMDEGRPDFLSGVRSQQPGAKLSEDSLRSLAWSSSGSAAPQLPLSGGSGREALRQLLALEHAIGGDPGAATRLLAAEASNVRSGPQTAGIKVATDDVWRTKTSSSPIMQDALVDTTSEPPLPASSVKIEQPIAIEDVGGLHCASGKPKMATDGLALTNDATSRSCAHQDESIQPQRREEPEQKCETSAKIQPARKPNGVGHSTREPLGIKCVSPEVASGTVGNDKVAELAPNTGARTKLDSMLSPREILIKGGCFLKHGRRGAPHRRYIWCNDALNAVHWCALNKRGPGKIMGKTLEISQIRSVARGSCCARSGVILIVLNRDANELLTGRTTEVFRRASGGASDKTATDGSSDFDALCFSLVAQGRTLDLEADSSDSRDTWVYCFEELIAGRL